MWDRILSGKNILLFEQNMISEEKSNATIEKYIRDIKLFYGFTGGRFVTKDLVIEYKKNLIDKGYSTRSINSMLASINSFFSFLGWFDCRVKSLKIQQEIFRPEEKELSKADYVLNILGALYLIEMLFLKKATDNTTELDVFDESSNLFTLKNWTTKSIPLERAFDVLADMIERDDGTTGLEFDA